MPGVTEGSERITGRGPDEHGFLGYGRAVSDATVRPQPADPGAGCAQPTL